MVYKDFVMPKTKFCQMAKNLSLGRTHKCKENISKGLEVITFSTGITILRIGTRGDTLEMTLMFHKSRE
jgi:hypothetical protein